MSLQLWLPMTKDLTQQGLSDVTITNNGATLDNNGKLGKCYNFTSTYVKFNKVLPNPCTQFSVCGWVKLLSGYTANNGLHLISFEESYGRICISKDGMAVRVLLNYNGTYSADGSLATASSITADVWNHYAVTFDSGTVKIYINGQLDRTYTATISQVALPQSVWKIGTFAAENSKGCVNDFRLYDSVLSPKEIEILSRGLVAHYPLNGGGHGGDNIISGTSPNEVQYTYPSSSYSDKFSKTSTIIPSASQYVLSFWAKSTHAGDKVRAHWYSPNTTTKAESNQGSTSTSADGQIDFTLSDKWEKYWCVWTQSSTTAVKHFIFPRMFSQASGGATGTGTVSVKCVKLEEGTIPTPWMPNSADSAYSAMGYDSTTEYDVSGYGYNGTKTGTIAYLTDTPRYNVSTNIKGASSYIKIPNLTTTGFSNSYSFAWWGKVPSYQGYMMWGFSDGQRLNGIFNGNLWNTGDGANNPLYVPGTTTQVTVPTTNTWHHFVMTGDGTTCKVYQDGVLWGQAKTYKSISGTTIYINGWDAGTNYTYGDYQMSDFRIYATALSAAQVAELYNTAVSVANNGTLMGYELVEG